MKSKNDIRQEIGKKRAALNIQWVENASARIIDNFQSLDIFQSAETVALYKAIRGEVNLEPLFQICWSLEKRTAIPIFNTETRVYEMAEISASTAFRTGNYGIQEPIIDAQVLEFGAIDLIAAPGVGFDLSGNRLGRGGGYYDRMLDAFSGHAAGIGFEFQVLSEIPVDSHDHPVTHLVTETKNIKV